MYKYNLNERILNLKITDYVNLKNSIKLKLLHKHFKCIFK